MGDRLRVALTGVVIAAVLGACSGSSKTFSSSTTTSAPVTTTPTAPTSPTTGRVPSSFGALEARLITRVPAGFVRQPDSAGDTGPSDLAKAIRDDGAPDAASALRSAGFVRGYQRLWEGPQQAQIIVFVYEFGLATGAARSFARDKRMLKTEAPVGARAFTVAGLPPTDSAATQGTSPSGGSAAVVLFRTGVYDVQVVCNGPSLSGLRARVVAIALDQLRRLSRR